MKETISVIIPAWEEKEAASLAETIKTVAGAEVILALAEGDEVTCAPAGITTTRSPKGRAAQMNAGANAATGDILLFLHADTRIKSDSLDDVRRVINLPGVTIGAYRLKLEPGNLWLKLVAIVANLRSRILGMPYGDQALFIGADTFRELGGYEDIPILEDVRLVEAAKKTGRLEILDRYAVTSPRRWEERGMYKTTFRNWAVMIAYKLGVEPERLVTMFRR